MSFRPNPNDELTINGATYRVAEHPSAPGMPYGQEGRAGIVYRLLPFPSVKGAGEKGQALKVFKPRFRTPALVSLSARLNTFAGLPGLRVCARTVLTPENHADFLRREPDLTYAVLMPWIEGPTWFDLLQEKHSITPQQSLALACSLAAILTTLEQQGLAHCDLSAPNVLLPVLVNPDAPSAIEMVDVEQMYGLGMPRPHDLSSGTAGYAPLHPNEELWSPQGDRFSGAMLLAEMLSWGNESVRKAAWDESYFDPAEIQQESERYRILHQSLLEQWGKPVAGLFERSWKSESLAECPTFGEWQLALPQSPAAQTVFGASVAAPASEASLVGQGVVSAVPEVLPWAPVKGNEFESVFRNAIDAYRHREWALARELLISIVREAPNYTLEGYTPRALLAEVERQSRRRPVAGWVWGLVGGIVALCLLGGGAVALASSRVFFSAPTAPLAMETIPNAAPLNNNPTPEPIISQSTQVPLPTYTPYPTYTSLPSPTDRPRPTNTPAPSPTDIQKPINSRPSGKIVFTCQISYNSEQNEICLINADGSGLTQLTNNGANNAYASFAPDGRSIVFSSNMGEEKYQVYEMELGNRSTRQLTFDNGDALAADISLDGKKIVYKCSDANGLDYICVMNRDGSGSHHLYSGGWDPVWSPDGSQILFASGDYNNAQLYTIFADGSGLSTLLLLPAVRGRNDWSSLGTIATYAGASWQRNIYILKNSAWQQITNGGNSQAPSFSPDGSWLAFTGYFDHMNDSNGCEIYIMTIDGQNLTRLTNNRYCDWQPRWGP